MIVRKRKGTDIKMMMIKEYKEQNRTCDFEFVEKCNMQILFKEVEEAGENAEKANNKIRKCKQLK